MTPRLLFFFCVPGILSLPTLARCDNTAEKVILATYKLANDACTATGLAVRYEAANGESECFIVTAGHVLEQMKGDSCLLVSRTRREDGMFQRKEIRVPVYVDGKRTWKKHATHDVAILPLPDSVQVEAIPFDCLASESLLTKVHTGDAVWLAVFPERSEANNAGFPILRSGNLASFPITPVKPHPMFLVDTTSWKGDSGGPVVHQSLRSPSGGPVVLGIIRGMRNVTETIRESHFVQRKMDYPLGISEALHAAFARELIEPKS